MSLAGPGERPHEGSHHRAPHTTTLRVACTYALIRDVRTRDPERACAIPATALTAYASVDDRQRAVSAGFQRHVAKPVDLDHLVQTITALTGHAPRA